MEVKTVRLVSDSKSALERLQALHPAMTLESEDERQLLISLHNLHEMGLKLTFTWCPSHCGVPGNELADASAKEGTKMQQPASGWFYSSAKAVIRRLNKSKCILNDRIRAIYGDRGEKLDWKVENPLSRSEQVTLGRLRSGHHPDLKYWLFKIGRVPDIICR